LPCEFRKRNGNSRLISSLWNYAKKAGLTIIRTYLFYRPLKIFLSIGSLIFLVGLAVGWRVLFNYLATGHVSPYVPSAILTAIILIIGFLIIIMGLLADVLDANRKLNEDVLYQLRKKSLEEK
jgi:hypothetical protein